MKHTQTKWSKNLNFDRTHEEVQMTKIKSEIAVYQTARNAYIGALKAELEKN